MIEMIKNGDPVFVVLNSGQYRGTVIHQGYGTRGKVFRVRIKREGIEVEVTVGPSQIVPNERQHD